MRLLMKLSLFFIIAAFVFFSGTLKASPAKSEKPSAKTDAPDVNWVYFGTDEEGSEYSYDTKIIHPKTGNTVNVWVKAKYSEKKPNLDEARLLWAIDCTKKTYRGLSAYARTKSELTELVMQPSDWSAIPADSVMEDLYDIVCKKTAKTK